MLEIKNITKTPQLIDADKIILGIGVIAILFPFAMVLPSLFYWHSCYDQDLLPSISAYYHTSSRNLFVGMICALGFCFLSYKGYSRFDSNAANIAAVCAIGVAFVPTSIAVGESPCLPVDGSTAREIIHVSFAAILFLTLSVFSIKIFTHREPDSTPISARKLFLYRFYGFTILGALTIIAIHIIFLSKQFPHLKTYKPIFWLETVCLVSFGCSWLLKSELFDRKPI